METKEQPQKLREAGLMMTVGFQGVGKTYQNMHIIKNYIADKLATKVKGKKVLIFDTNGEYTKEQFEDAGITTVDPKKIALQDIGKWSRIPDNKECRRIDAKSLSIKEKKQAVAFIIKNFRFGLVVLEDMNTYITNATHMEATASGLINLRHKACDVLVSYQRLRAVEPLIYANSRFYRMHYQSDNVNEVWDKITHPVMCKIAQIIINNRYFNDDERFFVYINTIKRKIEGDFTLEEFQLACRMFLNGYKKELKEYQATHNLNNEQAMEGMIKLYTKQYY